MYCPFIFLKCFEHVYICLTITIWNAWIKLLLYTHIQQISFIPQLIEVLLIHQFEVLFAYPDRAIHKRLRSSFYGDLLGLGLEFGICQNIKTQLQLNSILKYCWFIILEYFGHIRTCLQCPLEISKSVWCLFGCLPTHKVIFIPPVPLKKFDFQISSGLVGQ